MQINCKTGLAIAYQTCKQKQIQTYQETLNFCTAEIIVVTVWVTPIGEDDQKALYVLSSLLQIIK